MQKKLTITLDEQTYHGLYAAAGRRHISQFIEAIVRPYVLAQGLEDGYRRLAADEAQEAEALEWAEATIGDVRDEVGIIPNGEATQ